MDVEQLQLTDSGSADTLDTIAGHSTRVLICGSGEANASAMALRAAGAAAVVAADAEDCLFKALQRDFDAFILADSLSGGDVVALCSRLREIGRYRATPILALVSDVGAGLEALAASGVDDLVPKPLDGRLMVMRLRSLMRRMRLLTAERELREALSSYVSRRTLDSVRSSLRQRKEAVPEERTVCVMFADVRGSTSLSREMQLAPLFSMLSRLLAVQVDCVYRHGGDVDKFGGDGIMAVFEEASMCVDACRCALEMIDLVQHEAGATGGPPVLPVGIGLHVGRVLMGNIGSSQQRDYSVLGETANLASRLSAEAEGGNVVVSDTVYDSVADTPGLVFSQPVTLDVKGFDNAVTAFALRSDGGVGSIRGGGAAGAEDYDRRHGGVA